MKEEKNKKVTKEETRYCVSNLSDLYPSTCPTREAFPGVKNSNQHRYQGQ